MGDIFNLNNGFFTFLSKICDMIFLSILWALFCIPVITIGPANTALYYATAKVIRRERGYIFREFFKSFRLNFMRGAIVGVVLTIIFTVLSFDLIWSWSTLSSGNSRTVLFGIFVAITFLVLCFSIYVFPILSRFDMNLKQLIKASIFISIKHLPSTLGMVVVTAASICGIILIPVLIFFIPALSTYINSFLMEAVLKKYIPEAKGSEEIVKKDEWYKE